MVKLNWAKHVYIYILYGLITTVTQNMRKTSSNCMVKEVQPWFACRRVEIVIDYVIANRSGII